MVSKFNEDSRDNSDTRRYALYRAQVSYTQRLLQSHGTNNEMFLRIRLPCVASIVGTSVVATSVVATSVVATSVVDSRNI
jgi:hypothetical protein